MTDLRLKELHVKIKENSNKWTTSKGDLGMPKKKFQTRRIHDQRTPYSVRKRRYPRKTVLIVDDDELLLRAACRLLQNEWDIFTARSAAEALTVFKEKRVDVVLTDYEMPGKNGLWLLRQVRRSNPTTHRVLFSGIGPKTLMTHITSGLVGRFVTKPPCRDDLLSALTP